MRPHSYPLTFLVFALGLLLGAAAHKAYAALSHPLKDTGPVQVINIVGGHAWWFIRPNREIFEAYFDNPPVLLGYGARLDHLWYRDDNAWMRHFEKAQASVSK